MEITGLILAGGRGSRMGHIDKGLVPLDGVPMVQHVIKRLQPQVQHLLINANQNLDIYAAFGMPVWPDALPDFAGPLAGLQTGLMHCKTPFLVTAPCDSPLLPPDYAQRMWAALEQKQAIASVGYREGCWQPVFALLPVHLHDDLADYLATGSGGAGRWLQQHSLAPVEFPDAPLLFRNLNTPDDLARLEADWPRLKDTF